MTNKKNIGKNIMKKIKKKLNNMTENGKKKKEISLIKKNIT